MKASSENARAVAREVIDTVRRGKKVNKQEIQQRHGYTASSAKAMKATRTQTYQNEIKPYVKRLEDFREKILTELETKDLTKVKFRELSESLNKTTHDIQLLSGGSTENVFQISWQK